MSAPRIWFYKPQLGWRGSWTFLPVRHGNDEWHRHTIVLGLPITGQIVIPLWHYRDDCPMCECGMMQWPNHEPLAPDEVAWYCPECDEPA